MIVTKAASASDLIQAIEQADSPTRLVAAVQALADSSFEEGIPTLITVLGYNNPEAAGIAVKGLVQFGEAAVPTLLSQLDDYNYGARAYSFRALAAIADPRALDVLLSTAETDFAPSVRRAAAKGLGNLCWDRLPVEQRQSAQKRALQTLLLISRDPDWAIRYAAIVGLQALAVTGGDGLHLAPSELLTSILQRFAEMDQTDPDLAVRARACLAQQQLKT